MRIANEGEGSVDWLKGHITLSCRLAETSDVFYSSGKLRFPWEASLPRAVEAVWAL